MWRLCSHTVIFEDFVLRTLVALGPFVSALYVTACLAFLARLVSHRRQRALRPAESQLLQLPAKGRIRCHGLQVTPHESSSDSATTKDSSVNVDTPNSLITASSSTLLPKWSSEHSPMRALRSSTSGDVEEPGSTLLWERAQSSMPTSLDQKFKMADLENGLSAFESEFKSLELRSNRKSTGAREDMALKGDLLDLSERLDILMQDAMVEVCNRLPGASHIFGEASLYMDRIAQLVRLCESHH
eukprot:TRINITY_DN2872_c0_g1_i3.p1 TRINITY_DN2872_c0_g1~~TRINITY_DN2872_c0_g1_i3.p1  ORF type:complete len:243 (+),score=32.35 TRINITY_DN2872_c0_g1_i3:162-890(+)